MTQNKNPPEPAEFLLYQTEDGQMRLEVAFRGETCWLSLNQLAELFQRDKSVISRHIRNLFDEGELVRESVVAKFATTAVDGKSYLVDYFNLDVIISVGYETFYYFLERFITTECTENTEKTITLCALCVLCG